VSLYFGFISDGKIRYVVNCNKGNSKNNIKINCSKSNTNYQAWMLIK